MFCICVLIIAAAAVYMVEAYIHTYYAIEYMHGTPLFFVLLAKYAAPVLFLLLCGYFVFRYREKRRESEKPAQDTTCTRRSRKHSAKTRGKSRSFRRSSKRPSIKLTETAYTPDGIVLILAEPNKKKGNDKRKKNRWILRKRF